MYQYVPTHWLPKLCAKNAFFGHFGDFQPQGWIWAKVASRFMTFFLGHAQIINIWRSGWESDLHLYDFHFFFFAFPFTSFLIFLQQWLAFYWVCFQFPNFWESIVTTGKFYHGVAKCSGRILCCEFSLKFPSIFVNVSGSNELITLIWVSVILA